MEFLLRSFRLWISSLRENFGNHCARNSASNEKCQKVYHPSTDGQTEQVNQVLEGYLRILVNCNQNDWYHLLPLAQFANNNSITNAHGMTSFFANYQYYLQDAWLKEREVQNPGATMYPHWMQTINEYAKGSLERTKESMGRYYDRKAKQQPDIKVGDLVMLNRKNIHTQQPAKKLAPKLYSPYKLLKQRAKLAYIIEISDRWDIHLVFHVSLLDPYRRCIRPAREHLQCNRRN